MNEENSQEQQPIKTVTKRSKKDTQFKVGNPGGPGRPKGKTLKEFQAEMFRMMTDEQKLTWLDEHKVSGETIWKMAEGNPKNDVEVKGNLTISQVLDELENGQETKQPAVEDKPPLQNQEQAGQTD